MTGWIIAGVGLPLLGWLLLHFIKEATRYRSENEALKKTTSVQKEELDTAARPSDSPDNVIEWLQHSKE